MIDQEHMIKYILLLDHAQITPIVAEKLLDKKEDYQLKIIDRLEEINTELSEKTACVLMAFSSYADSVRDEIKIFLKKMLRLPIIIIAPKLEVTQQAELFDQAVEVIIDYNALSTTDITGIIDQAIQRHAVFFKLYQSNEKYKNYFNKLKLGMLKSIYAPESKAGFLKVSEAELIEESDDFIKNLQKAVHYDYLTQIPNRKYFEEALKQKINHANHFKEYFFLCIIDVDHFKNINDTHGHDVGDALLKIVAQRLRQSLRDSDIYARLGGDEFAFILMDSTVLKQSSVALARLTQVLCAPYSIGANKINITVSIGVARYDFTTRMSFNILMKNADLALYNAKKLGRNRLEYFAQDIADSQKRFHDIAIALQNAIQKNEFHIMYQPIVDLESEEIVSLEALLRWNSSALQEDISPNEFISIAENCGMILKITDKVIELVCQDIRQWLDENKLVLPVAINFSVLDIAQKGFAKKLQDVLNHYKLSTAEVGVEVTETAVMEHHALVQESIFELRTLGFNISIDDFGTGYSSLARLREVKFDKIKIDRSFIVNMLSDVGAMKIVRAVIELAKQLGVTTVAEGVETEEEVAALKAWHCDCVQGYYYSKPLLPQEVFIEIEKRNGSGNSTKTGLVDPLFQQWALLRTLIHDIHHQLESLLGYVEILLHTVSPLMDEYNAIRSIHFATLDGIALCTKFLFAGNVIQKQAGKSLQDRSKFCNELMNLIQQNGRLFSRILIQLDYVINPLLQAHTISDTDYEYKLGRMSELLLNLKILNENLIYFKGFQESDCGKNTH